MTDPSVLPNPGEFSKALGKARRELIKLPGVRGVGYGYKEVDGKSTGEIAIVVFVDKKKTRRYVPTEERIPADYLGVKTDVVELGGRELEGHDDSDMMFVDFAKIHRENQPNIEKAKKEGQAKDPDF